MVLQDDDPMCPSVFFPTAAPPSLEHAAMQAAARTILSLITDVRYSSHLQLLPFSLWFFLSFVRFCCWLFFFASQALVHDPAELLQFAKEAANCMKRI